MKPNPTRSALIMIDMENGFVDPQGGHCIRYAQPTVPACVRAVETARRKGIPVFFVKRVYRADGSDVEHTRFESWLRGGKSLSPGCAEDISDAMPEEFGECERDYHIIKPRFSHTELDLMLRRLGIDTVILTGTTTPNCIRTSCYDAISLEYNVVVIEDCTSSATPQIQSANILDMKNIGAQILSSAEFIGGAALSDSVGTVRAAVKKGI